MARARIPALLTFDPVWRHQLFDARAEARLGELLHVHGGTPTAEQRAGIEVLITGWGSPTIGEQELDALPALQAVFHAAGTLRGIVTDPAWERIPLITSAAAANAIPVAEYTLAMILLAGKRIDDAVRRFRFSSDLDAARSGAAGNFRTTVGIIGASTIGRLVLAHLESFDLNVLVADPTVTPDSAIGSAQVVGLDELLASSDVVSVHAPLLPQTRRMIGHAQLQAMRPGTTLINTARGGLVDHDALAEAVIERNLHAVLDVTDPEPLPLDHPLRRLDGVVLTPHVAGARGNELRRLGDAVLTEVERYAAGLPPLAPISAAESTTRA
jgi:phosphoglycerate dehydrogenase-like enzyme